MGNFTRSNLFSKGHPLKAEPSLSAVLDDHLRRILGKIAAVADLGRMSESFLAGLVKESLVEPLSIRFDQMTRSIRPEQIGDGRPSWVAQVARLSIPFTGDPVLLRYAPNPCGLTFPRGDVRGNTILFDVVVGDAQGVKAEVEANQALLASCAEGVNRQARDFNQSVPTRTRAAFDTKLTELTRQHAIFDELGIKEGPSRAREVGRGGPAQARPSRPRERAAQIIQYVEAMYVQQLNQVNYNAGDVNNAIQSDE